MSFFGEDKDKFKLSAGEDSANEKIAPKLPVRNSSQPATPRSAPPVSSNRARTVPVRPRNERPLPPVNNARQVPATESAKSRVPLPPRPKVEQQLPLDNSIDKFDNFIENSIEHNVDTDYRNANLSVTDFLDVDEQIEMPMEYSQPETQQTAYVPEPTHYVEPVRSTPERAASNDYDNRGERSSFQASRTTYDDGYNAPEREPRRSFSREEEQGYERPHARQNAYDDGYDDGYANPRQQRQERSQPVYNDPYDDEPEEDERRTPPRNAKSSKATTKSKGKAKKTRGKKNSDEEPVEKEPSRFFGKRKPVLIIRIAATASILGVFGFGLYGVFSKPYIPSQTDVVGLINNEMNVTKFDKDGGRAFVSAFAKEYFTFNGSDNRNERMKSFAGEEVASILMTGANSDTEIQQAVSGEPYITSIKAFDDYNAIYNIGVKINSKWMYSDIPVFYDPETKSYSITGAPIFTTPPSIIENIVPSEEDKEFEEADTELVTETQDNIKNFFGAWAKSDATTLGRYVTSDASVDTKSGLRGSVIFKNLLTLEIEAKLPDDPTATTRKAVAVVEWANSTKAPVLTYQQTFVLELFQQPDGRWYVADITTDKPIYEIDKEPEAAETEELTK